MRSSFLPAHVSQYMNFSARFERKNVLPIMCLLSGERIYICGIARSRISSFSSFFFYVDPHAGRLERRPVQRYAEDVSLGRALFRSVDDLWQLRSLQSSSRHSRRRFLVRGKSRISEASFFMRLVYIAKKKRYTRVRNTFITFIEGF